MITSSSNKALLDAICFKLGALNEAQKRFSAQLAPNFNLNTYVSTRLVCRKFWLIYSSPDGAHEQGTLFLKKLAKHLEQDQMVASDKWEVETEKQANGQRRIDIYLSSKLGDIAIENKPWAGYLQQQLSDYADFLCGAAPGRKNLLIYLSNGAPSENSISSQKSRAQRNEGRFIHISFYDLADWLEECASQTKALSVRVFIEQLAKFLRTNINGELDISTEKEVVIEILKSTESMKSAFRISNSMNAFKTKLLDKFHNDLKSELEPKGFELEWKLEVNGRWKAWDYFGVAFNNDDNFLLKFEFERAQLWTMYWGISRKSNSEVEDKELWQKINEAMGLEFGTEKSSKSWPWYSYVPDGEFDSSFKNWEISESPWIDINNGNLSKKISKLAVRVHSVLANHSYLLRAQAEQS